MKSTELDNARLWRRAGIAGLAGGAVAGLLLGGAGLLWSGMRGGNAGLSVASDDLATASSTASASGSAASPGDASAARDSTSTDTATDTDTATIAALSAALDSARAEQRQLSEALRQLNAEVATLRDSQASSDATIERLQRDIADSAAAQTGDGTAGSEAGGPSGSMAGGRFNGPISEERAGRRFGGAVETREESLVAAGIDPGLARDIQQRSDAHQLARLELIDRAAREGWRGSETFHDEMQALEDGAVDLRAELGESGYDRYLYESGDTNRVQIASVITGSAAQRVGVEVGDIVDSYAGSRIFTMRELRDATRAGSRGELVQMTVRRDGQTLAMDIERGPLGVTMMGMSEPVE